MNNIKTFNNPAFGDLPVVMINEKPNFGATEAAQMLRYANPHDALIKHCRNDGVAFREVIDSLGRTQQKKFISEGNLYRLITHSKLPTAEKFEAWVFDEVLPKILRTGRYQTKEAKPITDVIRSKEADAKLMNARVRVARQYHKMLDEFGDVLGNKAKQQLVALEANTLSGEKLLIEPHVDPIGYSAGDLGKLVGWSANKVGKFNTAHDLKREGLDGETRLSRSPYSPKQVSTFVYNEAGKERFLELIEGDAHA